ncbi:thioredoxin-dependent thiol peroxidase [Candidatus Bathyarchaeota archaeon]|nr:thioredoxin-dependent thiol peroxidase [Candidatus Bathyarchaeota archaeon]
MNGIELDVGDQAPKFCLPDQDGNEACLKDFSGKWVVLYFYPKDNTKGCTLEALDFTMSREAFEEMGATVLGVSPDSVKSHRGFCDKHGLSITLLSDPEHGVLEAYGVWQLKKMYGREYPGVVRSTFLVDPEGRIAHAWRKVRVNGHVEAVKAKLAELK